MFINTSNINFKWFLVSLFVLGTTMCACAFAHQAVYLALAINFLTIIICKDEYILTQLFFMLPFAMIYKLSPSSSSFLTYLLLLYSIRIAVSKKLKLNPFVLLGIYTLLGSIPSLLPWIKLISGLIVLSHFVNSAKIDETKFYVLAFSAGLLVSSFMGLQKTNLPLLTMFYDDLNKEIIGGELIARFSALYSDPNYFSISIILAINLLLSFAMRREINKYVAIGMVVALTYFGFLSYSKMFMLALVLSILAQSGSFLKTSRYKFVAIIVLAGVLLFGISSFLTSDYFGNFASRIDPNNISTNRFTIWGRYLGLIFSDFKIMFLGVGISGDLYLNIGAHNTYIESLYHLGLIGSIIYVITLSKIINSNKIVENRTAKNYVPLFLFLVMICTLGCLFVIDLWFYYMLIWVSLNSGDLKEMRD